MYKRRTTFACALLMGLALGGASASVSASEAEHYEGKKAESLEQAVALFKEYNAKLEKILAKRPLDGKQMERVHKLTYTLENALGKMNSEMLSLTQTLEKIHKASERRDGDTVTNKGDAYLSTARTLTE